MKRNKDVFSNNLIFAFIYFILGIILSISAVFYFVFGLPLGLLFFSISIWQFAMWKYKKYVSLKDAALLFLLPIMGLYGVMRQSLQIPQAGFEGLIFWIITIVVVAHFFKKIKN